MGHAAARTVVIGPESQGALRAALLRSIQRLVPSNSTGNWDVTPLADRNGIVEPEFIMLTISAYTFRANVMLHFVMNGKVHETVSELLKAPIEKLTPERVLDCLGEFGNTLCGELKRQLGQANPHSHLGMSTPNRLARASLDYLGDQNASFETHARATRDGQAAFSFSFYLCTYGEVDFRPLRIEQDPAELGMSALELL